MKAVELSGGVSIHVDIFTRGCREPAVRCRLGSSISFPASLAFAAFASLAFPGLRWWCLLPRRWRLRCAGLRVTGTMSIVQAYVAHVCLRTWAPGAGTNLEVITNRAALAVVRVEAVIYQMC